LAVQYATVLATPISVDSSSLSFVKVLGANQLAFQESQQDDAGSEGQRQSDHNVNPQRSVEVELEPENECERRNRNYTHGEERWSVSRVGERIIQAANLASGSQ
jgi:hypothetical protein